MLMTDPLFKRKIQNVATTDKATWQFLFFLSDYEPSILVDFPAYFLPFLSNFLFIST